MNAPRQPQVASQVLAVLDDVAAGMALLEMSSRLARAMQRELSVVYVESARSLVAAALPFAQVLPHAGRQWIPLQTQDVERGFRADAARLREILARFALRDAVSWSLSVRRGSLLDTAFELVTESDLLLTLPSAPLAVPQRPSPIAVPHGPSPLAVSRNPSPLASPRNPSPHADPRAPIRQPARRRPIVSVLVQDGDLPEADRHARDVAAQLAQALGGVVEVSRLDDADEFVRRLAGGAPLPRPDVLVLPRTRLLPGALAWLRCPVVLVG